MNQVEQISLQYPSWTLLLCIVGGVLFALFLYYRVHRYLDKAQWIKPLLSSLRFLSAAFIIFLLLGPMLKSIKEEAKQPSVALILDDSQSIPQSLEPEDLSAYNSAMASLYNDLSEFYQVDVYAMDQAIRHIDHPDSIAHKGLITNISNGIDYISDLYEGENLGAVIISSDGIFNEGKNPLYSKYKSLSPIYTIALGDTIQRKDVAIKQILYNSVAYLEDKMLTQVDIQAQNAIGESLQLIVEKEAPGGYTRIASHNMAFKDQRSFETIEVPLDMNQVGVNHFRYRITTLSGEDNPYNNTKDIYIDVLDARQTIGIIAASPHPDIAALKQLLGQNKNYEVKVFFNLPDATQLASIDLAILHQLPSANVKIDNLLNQFNATKTPRVFIVGTQTDLASFNRSQKHVTITGSNGASNLAQASVLPTFVNFTLSDQLRGGLSSFPPLATPFGEYSMGAEVQTLLTQKIGKIETDFPLLSFADQDGIKTTFLFGTDIWRWKLFDYLQRSNFEYLSELLDKVVMYTSTKEDKRKFKVHNAQNIYNENEEIIFSAELYNNNYELVNDADVSMTITNENGDDYSFTFSRNAKSYILNAGKFQSGRYSYRATTNFNGQPHEVTGNFSVRSIQSELYDLQARHHVLYALSERFNGQMYYPENISNLVTIIKENDSMKPTIYQTSLAKPLLDNKWLFALLALVLAAEWLLRRYHGNL